MVTQKLKPTTIAEYINTAAAGVQERLWQLHECIRKAAPGATEDIKWRMPAYSYQKILVTFAVFKNHIGFYPMPSALEKFSKELNKYKTGEGSDHSNAIAWVVGWVEENKHVYFFVTLVKASGRNDLPSVSMKISKSILQKFGFFRGEM